MMLIEILLSIALVAIAVPMLVLLLQACFAASLRSAPLPDGKRPRIAVLVPAHDEAAGIAATVTLIRSQLHEEAGDRVVVVADNCSDNTASLAAAAGAHVLERHDNVRRGKGYALDHGVRHLMQDPPDALVFIDADCIVLPGSIERLARTALSAQRPVQALDLMRAPRGASLKIRIAEFAWVVKNRVRPSGFHRLGLPCQLMGTGMAFPWELISQAKLANGHIAEDMKLGIEMAKAGKAALFCPEACVVSYFPVGDDAARAQRTRWEHGHLGMIVGEGLPLLRDGIVRRDRMVIALALDMCVPPVALLTLIVGAAFVAMAAVALFTAAHLPFVIATAILAGLACAVWLSWWRFGRGIVSFGDLLSAVGYAFWKVPLYMKFLFSRQVEWVRAKRDAD